MSDHYFCVDPDQWLVPSPRDTWEMELEMYCWVHSVSSHPCQVFLNKDRDLRMWTGQAGWNWVKCSSHDLFSLITTTKSFHISRRYFNPPGSKLWAGDWSSWSHFQLLTGCGRAQTSSAVICNWSRGREGCIMLDNIGIIWLYGCKHLPTKTLYPAQHLR